MVAQAAKIRIAISEFFIVFLCKYILEVLGEGKGINNTHQVTPGMYMYFVLQFEHLDTFTQGAL